MDTGFLRGLRRKYQASASIDPDALGEITRRRRAMQRTRLMDLGAVAASLSFADRDALDPLAVQAIEDTNPTFDPDLVGIYSEEEWLGMVNSAKGKYFEYLVVDRLNGGEAVGDLQLLDGQRAVVAESLNQPGWDVQILGEDGMPVELLQMKATSSASYVRDALERYPDIQIVATDEVADHVDAGLRVLDVDMTEADLQEVVSGTYEGLAPGVLDEFWVAFNPLLPALLIAGTQGYSVLVGKQEFNNAVRVAAERATRGAVALASGAAVKVVADSLLLGASASLVAGMLFDRSRNAEGMRAMTREAAQRNRDRSEFAKLLLGRSQ